MQYLLKCTHVDNLSKENNSYFGEISPFASAHSDAPDTPEAEHVVIEPRDTPIFAPEKTDELPYSLDIAAAITETTGPEPFFLNEQERKGYEAHKGIGKDGIFVINELHAGNTLFELLKQVIKAETIDVNRIYELLRDYFFTIENRSKYYLEELGHDDLDQHIGQERFQEFTMKMLTKNQGLPYEEMLTNVRDAINDLCPYDASPFSHRLVNMFLDRTEYRQHVGVRNCMSGTILFALCMYRLLEQEIADGACRICLEHSIFTDRITGKTGNHIKPVIVTNSKVYLVETTNKGPIVVRDSANDPLAQNVIWEYNLKKHGEPLLEKGIVAYIDFLDWFACRRPNYSQDRLALYPGVAPVIAKYDRDPAMPNVEQSYPDLGQIEGALQDDEPRHKISNTSDRVRGLVMMLMFTVLSGSCFYISENLEDWDGIKAKIAQVMADLEKNDESKVEANQKDDESNYAYTPVQLVSYQEVKTTTSPEITELKQKIAEQPNYVVHYHDLAELYYSAGDSTRALQSLAKAESVIRSGDGQYESAISGAAGSQENELARVYFRRLEISIDKDASFETIMANIDAFENLLTNENNSTNDRIRLFSSIYRSWTLAAYSEDTTSAVDHLRELEENYNFETLAQCWYLIAEAYLNVGNSHMAEKYVNVALEDKTNKKDALKAYGLLLSIYNNDARYNKSIYHAEDALTNGYESAHIYNEYIAALIGISHFDKAKEVTDKAIYLYPRSEYLKENYALIEEKKE